MSVSAVSPSPAATSLADIVSALLAASPRLDPSQLPGPPAGEPPAESSEPAPEPGEPPQALTARTLAGPTGLGTAAARIGEYGQLEIRPPGAGLPKPGASPRPARTTLPLLGASRWPLAGGAVASDGSMPELFCPGAVRDDPALGEEVNARLIAWAEQMGIYPGRLDRLETAGFGRLMMLAHPGTDDPDRLVAAAQCVVAEWAADDYYIDEVELGADPNIVGSRLAILLAVVDPAPLPVGYADELDEYRRGEPIAAAFRSAMEHLAQYTSPTQMGRFQQQMGILFVAWNQEADWHRNGRTPPVWEYLVQRHLNSYLPPMILIDSLAGYELPPNEFYDPRVRLAFTRAGLANVLLNDLYSAAFESETDFNLPRVLVAEEACSEADAIKRTVEIHNELMHTFVAEASALCLTGSPMLQRFFLDTWAWLGGSREWHATTGRYRHADAE